MSDKSIPPRTIPQSPPALRNPTPKTPTLPDVAAVLLPGLQHASALIAVATKILSDLTGQPPRRKGSAAAEALETRRLLAAFGRVPKRG